MKGMGAGHCRCQTLRPESRGKYTEREWRDLVSQEILICLGGPLSEMNSPGDDWRDAAAEDIGNAYRWIVRLVGVKGAADPMTFPLFRERTRALLNDSRAKQALDELALDLMHKRRLNGARIKEICRSGGLRGAIIS